MSLALVLIARDEQRFLPGCLDSVRGVCDEVVVCDTGSTDNTVALARAAGATVVSFPWVDDFAAARNHALAASSAPWVLVLDADERLAPGAGAALQTATQRGGFQCGLLPLHNATHLDARPQDVLSGRARRGDPVLLPRLLRRDTDLRWEGAVHESVAAWLSAGRRARTVHAAVVHYGDVPEIREGRNKDARNLALLEGACQRAPTDAVRRTYLARELLRVGDTARATTEIARAWDDLKAALSEGRRLTVTPTATVYAFLLLQGGQNRRAIQVLDEAEPWCGGHPNLALLRGSAVDLLPTPPPALLDRAAAGLEDNLAKAGQAWATEVNPGACGWSAATLLGQLHLRRGDGAKALAAFSRALDDRPGHPPAAIGQVEARVATGQAGQALVEAQPLLRHNNGDAWFVAALAASRLGDRATARMLLRNASGRPWLSPARARRAAQLSGSLR